MKIIITVLLFFTVLSVTAKDNNTPVPFTLGDRDRLMRNEQKIDALRNEMNIRFESMGKEINSRFESVDKRFDSLEKEMNSKFEAVDKRFESLNAQINFLIALIILVLGGLMSLIGFVIYDRRTAIKPVQREQAEINEEIMQLKKQNNIFKETLKKAGML